MQLHEYRKENPPVTIVGKAWIEKADDEERHLSRGVMTCREVDSDSEVVDQDSALEKMPAYFENNPHVTFMHEYGGGVGVCVDYKPIRKRDDKAANDLWGIETTTKYGTGYEFGTFFWGKMSVDDIWKQVSQGIIRTQSIGFMGYEGGETEDGNPIIKVKRIKEYAITTVPAQEMASGGDSFASRRSAFAVALMKSSGVRLCSDCCTGIEKTFGKLSDNMSDDQIRGLIEEVRSTYTTLSSKRGASRSGASALVQALRDTTKALH